MKSRSTYKLLTFLGLIWVLPINRIYLGEKGIILRIFRVMKVVIAAIFVVGLVAVIVAGVIADTRNMEQFNPEEAQYAIDNLPEQHLIR